MLNHALGRFRFMGLLEGSSLVFLLFIAMPLKYWFGFPKVVTVVGTLHGYFVVAYFAAIVYAIIVIKWPFKFTVGAVISAFIPFGNFILDRQLKKWERIKSSTVRNRNV